MENSKEIARAEKVKEKDKRINNAAGEMKEQRKETNQQTIEIIEQRGKIKRNER